jgi:hypothetical protein
MRLSPAQISLIETLYEANTDLLELNISVGCALIVRGLAELVLPKNAASYLQLTDAGTVVAENLEFYRAPPAYREILNETRAAKYG